MAWGVRKTAEAILGNTGHGSTKETKLKRGHRGLGSWAGITGKTLLRYLLSLRYLRGIVPFNRFNRVPLTLYYT
jgi:hypothetical protein